MNHVNQFVREFKELSRTLYPKDFAFLLTETAFHLPSILRNRNLTALDFAMSRDLKVRMGHSQIFLPLRQVDKMLSRRKDSPTFGTLREMYARNCYLSPLSLATPIRTVLDLGANRGMFSLLALIYLDADVVVGVEPTADYDAPFQLLLRSNGCLMRKAPRYLKFVGSESMERAAPEKYVSIPTIMREQSIARFDLVKMDIEGGEKDVFTEPQWLTAVDHITMELHPTSAPDLSLIPAALERYGFEYRLMDRFGQAATIESALFAVASRKRNPGESRNRQ